MTLHAGIKPATRTASRCPVTASTGQSILQVLRMQFLKEIRIKNITVRDLYKNCITQHTNIISF